MILNPLTNVAKRPMRMESLILIMKFSRLILLIMNIKLFLNINYDGMLTLEMLNHLFLTSFIFLPI